MTSPRRSVLVVAVAVVAAVACGSEDEIDGGGGAAAAAGGSGGGSVEPLGCADDIVWTAADSLAKARDHHATFGFEVGGTGYLFVAGGWNYKAVYKDVHVAVIGDDPFYVKWSAAGDMPSVRAGQAMAQLGSHVFLAGGQRPGALMDEVIVAQVQPQGSLSVWQQQAPLPGRRFHLSMVSAQGQLIATGGLQESDFSATASVYVATPQDGVVTAWQTSTMPSPRSHHASFVAGDYLYVSGGLTGSPSGKNTLLSDVWRAPLLAGGGVGRWQPSVALPGARLTHAAFVRGRCVYLAAGLVQPLAYSDQVLAAPFDEQGNIGQWRLLPSTLPVGRSHMHHVAVINDHAYLLGGSTSVQNVTGESAVGTFVHNQ